MPSGRGQIAGRATREPRSLRTLAPGDEVADEETGERFRVLSLIGQGGMGRVFRAEAIATGQVVAIKCNQLLDTSNEAVLERTRREGGFLKRLQRHPHIVPVLATGMRGDGVSWMVMPLLEGASVGALIETIGRIPLVWTLRIVQAVCSALAEAHRYALHRDIKPENVFVTRQGNIYVLDFGAGKFYAVRRLTTTGTTVGTIAYSSPEQLTDPDNLDGRSDLFSVGVMAFEMLTGVHPFDTDGPLRGNAIVIGNRIIREPPRPLAELAPGLPGYMEQIVHKLLEKDRRDRSRSAAEAEQVYGAAYREVCSRLADPPPIERIFDLYDEILREQEREALPTQDTEQSAAERASGARPRFGTVPIAEFVPPPAPVGPPPAPPVPPNEIATPPVFASDASAPPRLRNKTIRMGPPVFGLPPLPPSDAPAASPPTDGAPAQPPASAAPNDAPAPPPANAGPNEAAVQISAIIPVEGSSTPIVPAESAPAQAMESADTDDEPPSSERSQRERDEYINRKLIALDRLIADATPETRSVLIQVMCEPEEEPVIRAGAGLVLLSVGDEASLDAMQSCAENDPNPVVRRKLEEYAVELARRLGVSVEPLPFLSDDGPPPLPSWVPPPPEPTVPASSPAAPPPNNVAPPRPVAPNVVPSVVPPSEVPSSVTPTLLSQGSVAVSPPAPAPPVLLEVPPATTTQRSRIVVPNGVVRAPPAEPPVSVQPPKDLVQPVPPAPPAQSKAVAIVVEPRPWSTGALVVLALASALVAAALVLVLLFFVFK